MVNRILIAAYIIFMIIFGMVCYIKGLDNLDTRIMQAIGDNND